jgi:formamidopyrimidine-DNA glycosylase
MPELPDVEGFKEYLDATSLHQKIARTRVSDERLLEDTSPRTLAQRLKGAELKATERYGKYLFARVSAGGWLLLHFGMTGGLTYYREEADAPEYAKVTLDFENGYHLAYTNMRVLGKVGFVEDMKAYVEHQGLGPDALGDGLTGKKFAELLAGRKGPIKARLMDQSMMAGVGNEYSDEILFQARLHPMTDAASLSDSEIRELYRVMRRVLRTAASKGGDSSKLPRGYLLPHRAKGEPCPRCGGEVQKITVNGRSGYFCPSCQKKK